MLPLLLCNLFQIFPFLLNFLPVFYLCTELEGTVAYSWLLLAPVEGWWPSVELESPMCPLYLQMLGGPFANNFYLQLLKKVNQANMLDHLDKC